MKSEKSESEALSLRLRQTFPKTDYQAVDALLHWKSTRIILGQKSLSFQRETQNYLSRESFVLRLDQTISQGGQVGLSRLPTGDVMVVVSWSGKEPIQQNENDKDKDKDKDKCWSE